MIALRWTVSLFLMATLVAGMAQAEDLETVKKEVAAAWDKTDSLTAKMAIEASVPVGKTRIKLTGSGTTSYAKSESAQRWRQKLNLTIPEPLNQSAQVDVLFDGTDLYVTLNAFNSVNSSKGTPALSKGAVPPGGERLFAAMEEELDLSLGEGAEIDGVACHTILGTPKPGTEDRFNEARVHIVKETGALKHLEVTNAEGLSLADVTFTDIKLNEPVDDSAFVYTAPAATTAPAAGAGGGPLPAQPLTRN